MFRYWTGQSLLSLLAALVALAAPQDSRATTDGKALLDARCAACHDRTSDGRLSRISDQRKTPEAWDMTLVRMMQMHGVEMTADERAAMVKYLADSQGLAPAEAAPFRYILEREPGVFEEPASEDLGVMCARCHSYARVALQRRTEEEWRKLSHFHLGQYPTAEYQALGRDRNWWEIASGQMPGELVKLFPLETAEWDAWKDRPTPDLAGSWRFVGSHPGRGDYHGSITLKSDGNDRYSYEAVMTYADGSSASGQGQGILYTGYEWRGRTVINGSASLQVLALSEDGSTMTGRSFFEDRDSIGGRLTLVRADGGGQILDVVPAYLRAGESGQIAIQGVGLGGDVDLGAGVTIENVVSSGPETVVVQARADDDAPVGPRAVSVGDVGTAGLFTVYEQIDRLTVEPGYAIARVGDAEGPLLPVPAQFEAIGWLDGPDGKAGTGDDVRIGVVPAGWSTDNFDATAATMDDVNFAGTIGGDGLFMPAGAGPNPKRPYQTNNGGNLKVIAKVEDGERTIEAEAQLIVTMQRWNDPPIR